MESQKSPHKSHIYITTSLDENKPPDRELEAVLLTQTLQDASASKRARLTVDFRSQPTDPEAHSKQQAFMRYILQERSTGQSNYNSFQNTKKKSRETDTATTQRQADMERSKSIGSLGRVE